MMRTAILIILLTFQPILSAQAVAEGTVFVIRHGEKATDGNDPPLTDAGRERAANWAKMLQDVAIDVVITSDARRTRETGDILADALKVSRVEHPIADVAGLLDLITFDHEGDQVVIVGHTETIPSILSGLGVSEPLELDQADFARIFVVSDPGEDASLISLWMP